MLEETISTASTLDSHRYRAALRLFRQLRHELATPLSGAALHLELARRRLTNGRSEPERAVENLSLGQREVARAAALLETLTEVFRRGEDEAGRFPLPETVVHGAARVASEARARRVTLVLPDAAAASPSVYGSRRQVEESVADLTAEAIRESPDGGVVTWSVQEAGAGGGSKLVCSFTGSLPAENLERLFGFRPEPEGGEPDAGLLLARWAVESQGGELHADQDGGECRFVIHLPEASA